VWIVDDSPTEASITERSLGPAYEFEKFDDGSVVVERLAAGAKLPDVVLLDWVMPGMAGPEVCEFVRSHPATRTLPIILLTASRVETGDVVEGLASGANDYVARPFVPEELRARVDAVVRAAQLRDAAASERQRLRAINELSHSLLEVGADVRGILDQLTATLTAHLCDGCAILLLPGVFPSMAVARHRGDPDGAILAAISSLADPVVHAFDSTEHARRVLSPAYQPYIDRFGLRGLAILPFPISEPIQGVVTVTRDVGGAPFAPDDIATIETCIEYAGLAVETALRFDAERAARDQLRAVLEQLPLGIVATDADGALTLVNAAASRLVPGLETAADRAAVYPLASWAAPDGTPVAEADLLLGQLPQSNQGTRGELVLGVPGAPPRTVVMLGVPLRDARGDVVGGVTAIEDVTAERAITAERERIAEFQHQMLGIVGHDLRNPLSAMLAGIALLDATIQGTPAVKVVRRLESSTHRMTRIVEQLLDMTRARLGQGIPIEPRDVDLLALVKSTVDEAQLAYPSIRFELVEADEVSGRWDPDRLAQVVSNLLGNAAQYGRKDAPVTVQLDKTDGTVAITVTNALRDKPIPPDQLAVLFDPYRRGRGSEHRRGGLGLGLYIVQQIVQAHGGTIEVVSTTAGTSFCVLLPLRR
jgi:signal transduction histidine kinase/DNA-binding response OmpR family regulator